MLELYTRDGVGTLFSTKNYEDIHPANIDHVTGILALIKPLEDKGILIKRSREQLELEIDNFSVIERDEKIIGCAACYHINRHTNGRTRLYGNPPQLSWTTTW